MSKIKVIYLGYDIPTVYLINSKLEFELIGVASIPELLTTHWNIFDTIFIYAYKLKIKNSCFLLQSFLVSCLIVFYPFLSSLFKKYYKYLRYLTINRIPVLPDDSSIIEANPDVIIVNNWWKISTSILNCSKYGCINVHPSLLPKYRGSLPTLWSLKNHDQDSAVSFFLIAPKIDTGRILTQHKFNILSTDNSLDLEKKIESIIRIYLLNDIIQYINGEIRPYEQDSSGASYTAKYYEYMIIDFKTETDSDIFNKVLLYPYLNPIDLCYFKFNEHKIYIQSCMKSDMILEAGSFRIKDGSVHVGCSNNSSISFKLFRDLNLKQSIYLILNMNGDN